MRGNEPSFPAAEEERAAPPSARHQFHRATERNYATQTPRKIHAFYFYLPAFLPLSSAPKASLLSHQAFLRFEKSTEARSRLPRDFSGQRSSKSRSRGTEIVRFANRSESSRLLLYFSFFDEVFLRATARRRRRGLMSRDKIFHDKPSQWWR